MKNLLLVLISMSFISILTVNIINPITLTEKVANNANNFCEGWSDGYKEGYCYEKGYGCLSPLVPLCPLARIGEDTYKGGYNRGFIQGKRDNP